MPDRPSLPSHIETTVQSIADLHLQHHREASSVQRTLNQITRFIGRPRFVGLITLVFGAWVGVNLTLHLWGHTAFDPPPFAWLEVAATLLSVYIALLILITQRHENKLTMQRERLSLELGILADQKTAKIIQLLEELRRDHPQIADRINVEAAEMARPVDTQAVVKAIKESHGE
jgi:uncharacterized membrane protein